MKRLLFVTSNDAMGKRFNGIDWMNDLESLGFKSSVLLGRRPQEKDERIKYLRYLVPVILQKGIKYIERKLGTQSRFSPSYLELNLHKEWRDADVLHFQLVHDGSWFRIEDFPRIARNKPTIWTWHDAWPITGHCIQPLDCEDFMDACRTCTHLDWPMPLYKDNAFSERARKARIINNSNVNIHVTTNWMAQLIEKSGQFENTSITVIPFGIDATKFNPRFRESAREKYGISNEAFVIGIRASDWIVKNTILFKKTIQMLKDQNKKVIIFTYEKLDGFWDDNLTSKSISIRDFGWLSEDQLIETYKCLDVFLGISTGESFGLMPLEAAACGAIPISLKGTAVSEFVNKIDGRLVIQNSATELKIVLETLIANDDLRSALMKKGLDVVAEDYSMEVFFRNLTNFYDEVIRKQK